MKIGLSIFLALNLFACSDQKKSLRDQNASAVEISADAEKAEKVLTSNTKPIPLAKNAPAGSQYRLASATALTRKYERVFLKRGNGRYAANPCDTYEQQDCQDSMFTAGESNDLNALILTRNVSNFREQTNFTLNYIRSLRSMLGRECNYLVSQEWARLEADDANAASNKLVKKLDQLDAVAIDEFFKSMLGLDGTDIQVNTGASEYKKAFAASLPAEPTVVDYRQAYSAVCIAVSMDPAILIY